MILMIWDHGIYLWKMETGGTKPLSFWLNVQEPWPTLQTRLHRFFSRTKHRHPTLLHLWAFYNQSPNFFHLSFASLSPKGRWLLLFISVPKEASHCSKSHQRLTNVFREWRKLSRLKAPGCVSQRKVVLDKQNGRENVAQTGRRNTQRCWGKQAHFCQWTTSGTEYKVLWWWSFVVLFFFLRQIPYKAHSVGCEFPPIWGLNFPRC